MSGDDIGDPRDVPGVLGASRGREWDVVSVVELPELENSPASDLSFLVLEDGSIAGDAEVPGDALGRITAEVGTAVRPPYEVRAARRGRREWSVAARELRIESVALPDSLPGDDVAVAVGPEGDRTVLVDGEEPEQLTPELEAACAELERRGRERFSAFVARAERVGPGRWELSVDPL